MNTIGDLIDGAEAAIRKSKAVDLWRPSDARVNAEELMEAVVGYRMTSRRLSDQVSESKQRKFEQLVARRVAGEPVAMITGKIDFLGLELIVRKGVFIPRNSSELLARKAIERLRRRPAPVAVDVATGTGPVALAVAKKVPAARVFGLDIASRALGLAQKNAARLHLGNVTFLRSDLLSALPPDLKGRIDVFTSHPPYVAEEDLRDLPVEIKEFEPVESLTDRSDDGLGLVRGIASETFAWLRPGGWTLIEVSPNLSRQVRGILIRNGFEQVRSLRDSLGATRVICAAAPRG